MVVPGLPGRYTCSSPMSRTQTHPCTLVERYSRETSNTCAHIAAKNTSTASHRMPRKPRITLTDLPTDVLSCIAHHLRQMCSAASHTTYDRMSGTQQDGTLDDIAALRSVCRSLRRGLDLTATHANFHPHVDVEELRSVTRRCAGDRQ
jgi:hypothetical protein